MELFNQLLARLLLFVYHCFDRIVINGYLSALTRPENAVYFFREVLGVRAITKAIVVPSSNTPPQDSAPALTGTVPTKDRISRRRAKHGIFSKLESPGAVLIRKRFTDEKRNVSEETDTRLL